MGYLITVAAFLRINSPPEFLHFSKNIIIMKSMGPVESNNAIAGKFRHQFYSPLTQLVLSQEWSDRILQNRSR